MRHSLRLIPCVLLAGLVALPAVPRADDIIAAGRGSSWRYLDNGAEPVVAWRQPDFDDSRWATGPAPLGYGETRLGTVVRFGDDEERKPITTWFRRRFAMPAVKPGDRLVLSVCVDDGAIIYLNGQEVDRVNMPDAPVGPDTPASRRLDPADEGFYYRLGIPAHLIKPGGENVLAVEVHQAAAASSDLFFDLALKTTADVVDAPVVPDAARAVVDAYHQQHFIRPGLMIPDGYLDGGRAMVVDAGQLVRSGREILWVDRTRDATLARNLAYAKGLKTADLSPTDRIRRLSARIDREATPPGGEVWTSTTVVQLEDEFKDRPILIGEWLDQAHAGVCRHRALLFKIMADEAGLSTTLTRGNYAPSGRFPGLPHVWNEVALEDGLRILVDTSIEGNRPRFLDVDDPEVVRNYRRVDDSPWYGKGK